MPVSSCRPPAGVPRLCGRLLRCDGAGGASRWARWGSARAAPRGLCLFEERVASTEIGESWPSAQISRASHASEKLHDNRAVYVRRRQLSSV